MKQEITLSQLAALSLQIPVRAIRNWVLSRAEQHYLICADIEHQRSREAQLNVAYYQRKAAIARSTRASQS